MQGHLDLVYVVVRFDQCCVVEVVVGIEGRCGFSCCCVRCFCQCLAPGYAGVVQGAHALVEALLAQQSSGAVQRYLTALRIGRCGIDLVPQHDIGFDLLEQQAGLIDTALGSMVDRLHDLFVQLRTSPPAVVCFARGGAERTQDMLHA
ncbi:hypothetical protein D3C76_608470 [compost metagenome]